MTRRTRPRTDRAQGGSCALGFAAALVLGLGLAGADCTAGNYDIPACAISGTTLLSDSCQQLNSGIESCELYQCDPGSKQCQLKPRDYDLDGDPDTACGGTDCDDRNPTINGKITRSCECSPEALAKTCERGEGACRSKPTPYSCSNGQLTCPAVAGAPQGYGTQPDPANSSWDLNCDARVQSACCYQNANGTRICDDQCPIVDCSKIAGLVDAIKAKDPTSACDKYCKSFPATASGCPPENSPRIVRCSMDCGSDLALCYCKLKDVLIGTDVCERQADKTPVIDKVHCQ